MTSQLPGVTINGSVNIAGDTNYVSPKTVCLIAKTNGDTPLTQMTKTVLIPSSGSITTELPENASNIQVAQGGVTISAKSTDNDTNWAVTGSTMTLTEGADLKQGVVTVTYSIPDPNYWLPLAWYSSLAVDNYYGSQFNSNGSLNNSLSLGAYYAFQGGATAVIIQPYSDGGNVTLSDALSNVQEMEGINILVPIGCNEAELETVEESLSASNSSGYRRRAIFALDNPSTSPTVSTFTDLAASLNDYEVMLLGNTKAVVSSGQAVPPSMYACVLAGMAEFYDFNQTLTHKAVNGFLLDKTYTLAQISQLISGGVAVVSDRGGGNRMIESVVTTQDQSLDFSFAGVDNYLADSLSSYYDNYIGELATTTAIMGIQGSTQLFLQQQVSQNIIRSYSNVTVTQDSLVPTQIDVTFTCTWLPPIYNIAVNYTFDSNSQALQSNLTSTSATA